MKKLLLLFCLSICCLAASAQPTSFGGITPGQTTREELKGLMQNPEEVPSGDSIYSLKLKQPVGTWARVVFHNDIVYIAITSLDSSSELKQALIEKYGQPPHKVGGIRTITCRNKLGASFERFDGKEELQWPAKDGVQGSIRRWAGNCDEYTHEDYRLTHVVTVKAIERAELEQARKEAEEKRRKLGNAY